MPPHRNQRLLLLNHFSLYNRRYHTKVQVLAHCFEDTLNLLFFESGYEKGQNITLRIYHGKLVVLSGSGHNQPQVL